ncbi:hypothetical protein SCALM49S_07048 [Streptomyces californicus]
MPIPPASARSHSPEAMACAAVWMASREEEHAEPTDIAGPVRPSLYAMRVAA